MAARGVRAGSIRDGVRDDRDELEGNGISHPTSAGLQPIGARAIPDRCKSHCESPFRNIWLPSMPCALISNLRQKTMHVVVASAAARPPSSTPAFLVGVQSDTFQLVQCNPRSGAEPCFWIAHRSVNCQGQSTGDKALARPSRALEVPRSIPRALTAATTTSLLPTLCWRSLQPSLMGCTITSRRCRMQDVLLERPPPFPSCPDTPSLSRRRLLTRGPSHHSFSSLASVTASTPCLLFPKLLLSSS